MNGAVALDLLTAEELAELRWLLGHVKEYASRPGVRADVECDRAVLRLVQGCDAAVVRRGRGVKERAREGDG